MRQRLAWAPACGPANPPTRQPANVSHRPPANWSSRTLRAVATLLLATAALHAEEPLWNEDLAKAIDTAGGRPLALLFSMESCHWCHRMLAESADSAEVRQALTAVAGVHVRAERYPALTARLGISSFPVLVLVNRKGRLVKAVPGYLPMSDLATTLRVHALHGDETDGDAVDLAASVDVTALASGPDAVAKLVPRLGDGDVEQRKAVRAALARLPAARPALWQALGDTRLGVRVDAAAALAEQVGAPTAYDPFAPPAERAAAATAWRERVEKQGDAVVP